MIMKWKIIHMRTMIGKNGNDIFENYDWAKWTGT
jgi:hypothetical protein